MFIVKKFVPPIIFIILILFLWEFTVLFFQVPNYLLPRPTQILTALINNFAHLLPHIFVTFIEAFFGFLVGGSFGFFLALLFTYSKTLERAVYPYAIALKSVPIVALAPLLIVWFGNGLLPKVIVSAIISFFPVVVNSVKGLNQVDKEAYDLFDSLSATRLQVFLKLRLFSSLPYLFSALKLSSTLSVIGAIVGEFSGSDEGLGFFILVSSHRLETTDMFLGIILSSLLGISFFYVINILESFLAPWSKNADIND
jgi:NitT/TauT family transport system permease protein